MSNAVIFSLRNYSQTTHPAYLALAALNCLLLSLLCASLAASLLRPTDSLAVYYGAGALLGVAANVFFSRYPKTNSRPLRRNLLRATLFYAALYLIIYYLIGPLLWFELRFYPRDARHSICCETPTDYGATEYEAVLLNTADGGKIAGWYIPARERLGKVVVLIHGSGYDRRGTDFYARILLKQGYGILMYDQRNHGESSGPLNTFNRMDKMQGDLVAVITYLENEKHLAPSSIGIVGISLGGFAALNLPAATINRIGPLWLDGIRSDNFGVYASGNVLSDTARQLFDYQTRLLAGLLTSEPIAAPAKSFRTLLPAVKQANIQLVASGLDNQERKTNEGLIPYLSPSMSLWIIPNAWHIGGRFDAKDEYEQRMTAFFNNHL
ncbi:MAG TPA: alpha/beta fold hydrolase [Cellvibrionaceae bacterium]|nr:alpha/beta fold hydrolase [Cellvibrionaceae bacterium]HMW70494.1 alpha/beta fold hydrolase [Cellvibrionaceae bacterium]